mmetsp:Transcript_9965/g.11942  ORF Transcript_9965/g.11942 Transcript_9965/m.11942 type:complete len:104 (+) Transcript_9965:191-502(+)
MAPPPMQGMKDEKEEESMICRLNNEKIHDQGVVSTIRLWRWTPPIKNRGADDHATMMVRFRGKIPMFLVEGDHSLKRNGRMTSCKIQAFEPALMQILLCTMVS